MDADLFPIDLRFPLSMFERETNINDCLPPCIANHIVPVISKHFSSFVIKRYLGRDPLTSLSQDEEFITWTVYALTKQTQAIIMRELRRCDELSAKGGAAWFNQWGPFANAPDRSSESSDACGRLPKTGGRTRSLRNCNSIDKLCRPARRPLNLKTLGSWLQDRHSSTLSSGVDGSCTQQGHDSSIPKPSPLR